MDRIRYQYTINTDYRKEWWHVFVILKQLHVSDGLSYIYVMLLFIKTEDTVYKVVDNFTNFLLTRFNFISNMDKYLHPVKRGIKLLINFQISPVEVWELIKNDIPYFTGHVITYP